MSDAKAEREASDTDACEMRTDGRTLYSIFFTFYRFSRTFERESETESIKKRYLPYITFR